MVQSRAAALDPRVCVTARVRAGPASPSASSLNPVSTKPGQVQLDRAAIGCRSMTSWRRECQLATRTVQPERRSHLPVPFLSRRHRHKDGSDCNHGPEVHKRPAMRDRYSARDPIGQRCDVDTDQSLISTGAYWWLPNACGEDAGAEPCGHPIPSTLTPAGDGMPVAKSPSRHVGSSGRRVVAR